MNPRTAFISITVLVAACAVGYTQLPEQPTTSARIPPANVPAISPRPVREPSLDQMLDELEALRAQKAQIEKKEAELSRAIREKAAAQAERMNRLGVGTGTPDRIGRVIILGADVKTEKRLTGLIGFVPGQVLTEPAIAAARKRLAAAGLHTATVDVRASESGTSFKDIVVKVGEPGQ